jgi:uncharacterized lipoprotein YajG
MRCLVTRAVALRHARLKPLMLAAVLATLAACASDADVDALRRSEIQLQEARAQASVTCASEAACKDAWRLTQDYIASHSATGVTHADADVIETAQPHGFGKVWLAAWKTPADGGGTLIRLKAMCQGMYRSDGTPGWFYQTCSGEIRRIDEGFRRFVEEGLKRN